ncbi:Polyporopepsin [Psilocybe cubensis]|uniref:Polyporopepsin n=2 Tax=Psilocybe cubensis TaxID=181762 RepID=A0ACB8HF18_PSICU|nr:Polyporopepsin [Psilocybe cubensis]KAH9486071.1 Polyporopepsin [Psilocybe cubensis]
MVPSSLLATLILAAIVSANPILINTSPVTLPLSRRTNFTSVHNLLKRDQTRAKFFKAKGIAKATGNNFHEDFINEPITNQAVTYVANVGIGSPPTTYSLLIDTGSSNTWVGANKAYVKTGTSVKTSNTVSVKYGSGSFSGVEFTDTVTLASGLVIKKQSIGVASEFEGFDGVDGILGIGPVDLTIGTLSEAFDTAVPTVTDNLFTEGITASNEIAISFKPTVVEDDVNGEITWGGIDSSKFTGPMTYIPMTSTSPADQYWGIDQSVRYGSSNTILSTTAGIVDTGTTLILLATDAFKKYQTATKATLDSTTGLLKLSSANFNALQSLFFIAGGTTFELTANAQIWPRALNADIGGVAGNIYVVVADMGTPSGQGLDFINGFTFLERFYSVYDTGRGRVGLAATPFTKSNIN